MNNTKLIPVDRLKRYNPRNSGFPFPLLHDNPFIRNQLEIYNLSVQTRRHQHFQYTTDDYNPLCIFFHPNGPHEDHDNKSCFFRDEHIGTIEYINQVDPGSHLLDVHGLLDTGELIPQPFIGFTQVRNEDDTHWANQLSVICPHSHESNSSKPCLALFEYVNDQRFTFQEYFRHFKGHHHDSLQSHGPINQTYEGVYKNGDSINKNKFLPIRLDIHNEAMNNLRLACNNQKIQPFYLYDSQTVQEFEPYIRSEIGHGFNFHQIFKYEEDLASNIHIYGFQTEEEPSESKVMFDISWRQLYEIKKQHELFETNNQYATALMSCIDEDKEPKEPKEDGVDIFDNSDAETDIVDDLDQDHILNMDLVLRNMEGPMFEQQDPEIFLGDDEPEEDEDLMFGLGEGGLDPGGDEWFELALRELILPERIQHFMDYPPLRAVLDVDNFAVFDPDPASDFEFEDDDNGEDEIQLLNRFF